MSDRVLRAMFAGMARARVQGSGSRAQPAKAAYCDVACFAAGLVGLRSDDVVFGCRKDGALAMLRRGGSLPLLPDAVERLYAAAGAAMTFRKGAERVAMVFFERHEAGGTAWNEGLRMAAELPLVLVVLPRWKGQEEGDLCAEARKVGLPGIAVDAADAIALYRVAQESLVRARMGGGAALMEGVWFRLTGGARAPEVDAVEGLAAYLRLRGIASESWLRRVGSLGASGRGMGVDAGT